MRGHHDTRAGFGVEPALCAMERHAHPARRAVGRDIVEANPVEREPRHVGGRAVDAHHPPLHRAVIAEIEDGARDLMGPQTRRRETDRRERQHQAQRCQRLAPPKAEGQTQTDQDARRAVFHRPRFHRQGEIERHADPQRDRRPGHQRATLPLLQPRSARKGWRGSAPFAPILKARVSPGRLAKTWLPNR